MKIYIDRIPPEGIDLEENVPAGNIDLTSGHDIDGEHAMRLAGDVAVSVRAEVTGDQLIVRGGWKTVVHTECDRCLEAFDMPLEKSDSFFDFLIDGQDTIDLTDSIREDIILSFPIKSLCKDDCPGLCPKCGKRLSQGDCGCDRAARDIRFSVLDNLKDKLD